MRKGIGIFKCHFKGESMGLDVLIEVIVCGHERFFYYLTGDNQPNVFFMNILSNNI